MSASLDFPNNCSTNVYTLNDFGEIAYIVCTVATPPGQDSAASSPNSEAILARLQRTERQFREASILAALDADTNQLFTFYKKMDIANAKDQKTLLSKFGFVLRSNSCTIAYKTAARLPDLIKSENDRLYRLFTIAVLSSIKFLPNADSALQPVGANLYLVERATSDGLDRFESIKRWDLYRINLQIVPHGHVILSVAKDPGLSFLRMLELGQDPGRLQRLTDRHVSVYLAPVGRTVRLVRHGVESKNEVSTDKPGQVRDEDETSNMWKGLWKELLPPWLKENMNMAIDVENESWIEAEVPLQEVRDDTDSMLGSSSPSEYSDPPVVKKPLFWPARLCFVLDSEKPEVFSTANPDEDPMQFIQDWLISAGRLSGSAIKGGRSHQEAVEDDDEPLFAEDTTFDDPEHFHPFGPPAFPNSQTVYPTPPDVLMTQPTPGLSSIDGIMMTPANLARRPSGMAQQEDIEMQDSEEIQRPGRLSEFYGEDLFEEMPDDTFGPEANGEEPNWDFFDRPGVDRKPTPVATSTKGEVSTFSTEPRNEADDVNGRPFHDDSRMHLENLSGNDEVAASASTIPRPQETEEDRAHMFNTEGEGASQTIGMEDSQTSRHTPPPAPDHNIIKPPPQGFGHSRRSSIYEGVRPASMISSRDSKYAADGDYWFDPTPAMRPSTHRSTLATIFQRPSSSSSNSGSSTSSLSPSSAAEPSGKEPPALPRQWIEYQPSSPNAKHNATKAKMSAEHEIQQMLALLKPILMEPPSMLYFEVSGEQQTPSDVRDEDRLQVAQLLVDQMSQTSLRVVGLHVDGRPESCEDHLAVNVDISGINTSTHTSTVSQLVSLKTDSNGSNSPGKVVKLAASQICIRRADQPLFASTSILEFWDTLNLQPESGPKDVTAFCIHANARHVADGCSNLLQRMTDTYNSCALGQHSTGHIPGVADDGLVMWDAHSPDQSDLDQTCRKFGSALAAASNIKGTVLVYMISENKSAEAYLQVCQAFCGLFESYSQALDDRQDVFDVALQVIPKDFVACPETLVIPPQSAYIKLAIEVYNRLPPSDLSGPPAASGVAIMLAKADNSVHFRLSPTFTSPLSKDGPCLHLAYSVSANGRWITAAWTDELGRIALTVAYCVRIPNARCEIARSGILQEMWEVSNDIMGKSHSSWRLAVVKEGLYDSNEALDWLEIIQTSRTPHSPCVTMLASVQLEPALKVFPPHVPTKLGQPGLPNTYGTPASTPQASITSPDQVVAATPTPGGSSMVNAPTPSEPGFDPNLEGDLTLVDPTEESWAIILPYGVNQATSMVKHQPAAATALLLKRKGSKNEDGCVAIEVSLVNAWRTASDGAAKSISEEVMMDELMAQYRGLVTLATTRGCIDPPSECVPWHIATAVKGSRVLGEVL